MDLNTDTATLAALPLPQSMEEAEALGKLAEEVKPETKTDEVKKAVIVETAPAGDTKEVKEVVKADPVEAKVESDKDHNFALLRAANKRLQAEAAEAQRLLNEQLEKGQEKLVAPPDLATMDAQIAELRAEATRLETDYPDMAMGKSAKLTADILQGQRDRLAFAELQQQQAQEAEQKAAADQVRDAQAVADELIAKHPVLSNWQLRDPVSFSMAATQDTMLRELPEWKDKPMAERFEKAVELVKAANPAALMPEGYTAPVVPAKAAVVKAAPAKAADVPIRSLSDLGGGIADGKTELENVAELSAPVLANKLTAMTRDQQEEWLARLG